MSMGHAFVVEQMTVSLVTCWTEDSLRFGGLLAKSLAGRARHTFFVKMGRIVIIIYFLNHYGYWILDDHENS